MDVKGKPHFDKKTGTETPTPHVHEKDKVRSAKPEDLPKKNNYMDLIDWVAKWYKDNCNGDWEHTSGVLIETLDNPGWSIKIDLVDTSLEGKQLAEIFVDNSEDDWFKISSDGKCFIGYGDGSKLKFLIENFKSFAQL